VLIKFSPQRGDYELTYQYEPDKVIATLNDQTDVFDFSNLPDGELARDENGNLNIKTILSICPIVGARRIDGRLELTLLKFHSKDASYEERFPDPLEVF